MTIFAMLAFVMSIMWIQFTSNVIIALLQTFGFVTSLPASLLALTVIAWGNCLGDMTADVAMTKRGFGEMAVTGALAGPIFNILAGLGLGQTISIISFASKHGKSLTEVKVNFGLYEGDKFNKVTVLPLGMLTG